MGVGVAPFTHNTAADVAFRSLRTPAESFAFWDGINVLQPEQARGGTQTLHHKFNPVAGIWEEKSVAERKKEQEGAFELFRLRPDLKRLFPDFKPSKDPAITPEQRPDVDASRRGTSGGAGARGSTVALRGRGASGAAGTTVTALADSKFKKTLLGE
jgi:hypothetical protein